MMSNFGAQESAFLMVPKVDAHGVWVKRRGVPGAGRVGYKESEGVYWVVWEPTGSMGAEKRQSASRCSMQDLIVLPVKPSPWYLK